MRVPGDRGAVAAVHVDVLGAVDVVELGALAVAEPDRLRLGDLPVGGGPAGQHRPGLLDELRTARLPPQKGLLLLDDQLIDAVSRRSRCDLRRSRCHVSETLHGRMRIQLSLRTID
jgi:hypothetical protein